MLRFLAPLSLTACFLAFGDDLLTQTRSLSLFHFLCLVFVRSVSARSRVVSLPVS